MSGAATAPDTEPEAASRSFESPNRLWSTKAIVAFFAMAVVWSWGIGFAATQLRAQSSFIGAGLMVIAGFGPSVAALVVVVGFGSRKDRRDWLARSLNWRIGWRWFALAFLAPPVLMLSALAIHAVSGGALPMMPAFDNMPMIIANFGLVLLIGGPLGEEFGWRGYAMPALTARMNWRAASLIIGLLWGLWHLPLFQTVGTVQSQMPMAVFMLNILAGSVLFGWLWNRTGGSVLPAMVLHTSLNGWAGILIFAPSATTTGQPFGIVTGLMTIIAVALLVTPDSIVAKQRVPY